MKKRVDVRSLVAQTGIRKWDGEIVDGRRGVPMDLHYKGLNIRTGRVEWVEKSITDSWRPEGLVLEDWHVAQYRPFVEGIRDCIGRDLTRDELETIAWLSGSAQSTIDNVMSIIKSASLYQR